VGLYECVFFFFILTFFVQIKDLCITNADINFVLFITEYNFVNAVHKYCFYWNKASPSRSFYTYDICRYNLIIIKNICNFIDIIINITLQLLML